MPTKQKEDMVRAPYVTLPLRGTRYFLLFVVKKVGCSVGLRITKENQSYKTARKYADNAFDILYVLTGRSEEFHTMGRNNSENELWIEHPTYQRYNIAAYMQG